MPPSSIDVTTLLLHWQEGDKGALDRLISQIYGALHQIAANYMRKEPGGHTLAPTALVNEAYLQLIKRRRIRWKNRAQFFATAAQVMRWVLVDHAKAKRALKRGGQEIRVTLEGAASPKPLEPKVEALHEALSVLERLDSRQARLVELRFFTGLSIAEVGEVFSLAPSTVHKELKAAKAWIYDFLHRGPK